MQLRHPAVLVRMDRGTKKHSGACDDLNNRTTRLGREDWGWNPRNIHPKDIRLQVEMFTNKFPTYTLIERT